MRQVSADDPLGTPAPEIADRDAVSFIDVLRLVEQAARNRGLVACAEAAELVVAEVGDDGRVYRLIPDAAAAWRRMRDAAVADGIRLFIVSAHRGIDRQTEIICGKLAAGQAIEDILAVCAPPGYSEHHTGRAIDIATLDTPALEESFERTPAFAWLTERAAAFGFRLSYPRGNAQGYQYEPWHWCYCAPAI